MTAPMGSPHLADDRLDDYVDGLLDAPALEAARTHLGGCAACAERLAELRALLEWSTAERRVVEPPAELWPRVVASTIELSRLRRRVLRSIRTPLVVAAVALAALSSVTTAWVVTRVSADAGAAPAIPPILDHDAALDRALAALDHEHGPLARERIRDLRQRLAAADADLRRAPDDEALYRALAERERVVREIRPLLGQSPPAPRAPLPPSP